MIKEGMVVRYAEGWCEPEERKYLHVVLENRLNPVTNKMTRWLIRTYYDEEKGEPLDMAFLPTEVVEDYMIEPVWEVDLTGE